MLSGDIVYSAEMIVQEKNTKKQLFWKNETVFKEGFKNQK